MSWEAKLSEELTGSNQGLIDSDVHALTLSEAEQVDTRSWNASFLKLKGGDHSKAGDWAPYVVSDGLLITGQNPASSAPAAKVLLDHLRSNAA